MTTSKPAAKKPATPRKKNVKTPGVSTVQEDPKLVPPEPNKTDEPQHEDLTPKPHYIVDKAEPPKEGRVMGSHVLTDKGWIRQE